MDDENTSPQGISDQLNHHIFCCLPIVRRDELTVACIFRRESTTRACRRVLQPYAESEVHTECLGKCRNCERNLYYDEQKLFFTLFRLRE
jgi:hypothetical protein